MFLFCFGIILLLIGAFVALVLPRLAADIAASSSICRGIGGFVAGLGLIFATYSTMTYIDENKVGIVVVTYGNDLPPGQIIARNGEKGPQKDILGPGWHFWFWPWKYKIQTEEVTDIKDGMVGIVTALDGKPLPHGEIYAPECDLSAMLDATKFLQDGYKGPQLTVLTPGKFRLNSRLLLVESVPATSVSIGEVAVVRANAGKIPTEADIKTRVNGVPLVPKGYRGIWNEPLLPNTYYLHPRANVVYKIKSTNRVYEYSESDSKEWSDPIQVRSKDGFTFPVDVRIGVAIFANDAPYMVALLGDPDGATSDEGPDKGKISVLEARLILPSARTILRNVAENLTALQFVDSRSAVEKTASENFKAAMSEHHMTVDGVFIGQIDMDNNVATKALMQTRTDKEVAINQQQMYKEQEKAQNERAKLVKAQTQADQQKAIFESEAQVTVQTQKAKAREAEALGEAKYIEITAEARKKSYDLLSQSIGKEGLTMLEPLRLVKEGGIQITPSVMVGGAGDGGAFSALMGTILRDSTKKPVEGK